MSAVEIFADIRRRYAADSAFITNNPGIAKGEVAFSKDDNGNYSMKVGVGSIVNDEVIGSKWTDLTPLSLSAPSTGSTMTQDFTVHKSFPANSALALNAFGGVEPVTRQLRVQAVRATQTISTIPAASTSTDRHHRKMASTYSQFRSMEYHAIIETGTGNIHIYTGDRPIAEVPVTYQHVVTVTGPALDVDIVYDAGADRLILAYLSASKTITILDMSIGAGNVPDVNVSTIQTLPISNADTVRLISMKNRFAVIYTDVTRNRGCYCRIGGWVSGNLTLSASEVTIFSNGSLSSTKAFAAVAIPNSGDFVVIGSYQTDTLHAWRISTNIMWSGTIAGPYITDSAVGGPFHYINAVMDNDGIIYYTFMNGGTPGSLRYNYRGVLVNGMRPMGSSTGAVTYTNDSRYQTSMAIFKDQVVAVVANVTSNTLDVFKFTKLQDRWASPYPATAATTVASSIATTGACSVLGNSNTNDFTILYGTGANTTSVVWTPATDYSNIDRLIGFSSEARNAGSVASVHLPGSVISTFSGLTPNRAYYLAANGTLSKNVTVGKFIGVALNETTLYFVKPGNAVSKF